MRILRGRGWRNTQNKQLPEKMQKMTQNFQFVMFSDITFLKYTYYIAKFIKKIVIFYQFRFIHTFLLNIYTKNVKFKYK